MEFIFFKPKPTDIHCMQELVLCDVENGNILPRDKFEMATTIRSYSAVKYQNDIVGFVALHIHTPILAEIRSLIVKKEFRSKGLGQKLIQQAIDESKTLQIKELLVLTYQEKLFQKFGFNIIDKESIPNPKIWADCIKCKYFPRCDEIALLMHV
ncbi:N-acetylglutamate synthase [hydrothermal vent metagenome]|uniref:N-acetylglutamate synthase n=1 Tax=hydrothermal vent metagenome TaxID=652676 RepID=A0A3B1E690_9ZZZZ